MTFGRFSPKNGLLAFFSTVGREFFPFFLAPRDFSPVLYRCFILLYRRKTVWKGIKNIRFFAPIKKDLPYRTGRSFFMRRTAAQLSYLLRKRIRLYANERKYKRDNKVRRFFTASANGAYNTVRDGAKTQARQRSAPLFHGRRINRRAQKSPYASPRRRTPRIFSPFRLRRKRGR